MSTGSTSGPKTGMARNFNADVRYRQGDGEEKQYDLRVNHPLTIGSTELFLIGHGYAPVITIRNADGEIAWTGPQVFLPQGPDLLSFGVVKSPDAEPGQVGLEGEFLYPTFVLANGNPRNLYGAADNPLLSMNVYTGDLNLDSGESQSSTSSTRRRPRRCRATPGSPTGSTSASARPRPCPTASDGDLRRHVLVAADPDQPDAGQADRADRRGLGTDRADGLAVHPVAPDLGPRAARPRTGRWSRWPRSSAPGAATYDRCWTSWSPICAPENAAKKRRSHDRRLVGRPQPAGHRGRRRRLLPGADRAPGRVVVAGRLARRARGPGEGARRGRGSGVRDDGEVADPRGCRRAPRRPVRPDRPDAHHRWPPRCTSWRWSGAA